MYIAKIVWSDGVKETFTVPEEKKEILIKCLQKSFNVKILTHLDGKDKEVIYNLITARKVSFEYLKDKSDSD